MYSLVSNVKCLCKMDVFFRSSQIKNKITDTSFFAELIKDKHKRELELKKLLEAPKAAPETKAQDEVDHRAPDNQVIPMDIEDIPIPTEVKDGTAEPSNMSQISLPPAEPKPPMPDSAPPPLPSAAPKAVPALTNNMVPKAPLPPDGEKAAANKPKSVTKLPMPPGINQTDLEVIESPPSRSPTPTPVVKAKTPPPSRKGIMNLPMPPGTFLQLDEFPLYV